MVGTTYNNTPSIAYGTCETAAATAEKVVAVTDPGWSLKVGDVVGIKFTNSNTAGTVKLNVNSSGAIQVAVNTSRPYTGTTNRYTGTANKTIWYQYDGTYWCWMSDGSDANDNTYPSAYCSTGAGTAAKAATCTNYVLAANSYLHIVITNTNTSATALTLNVNGKGAKPIYINGTASSTTNYTLPAGSYICFYNGTNYYFRTDGVLPGTIESAQTSTTQAQTDNSTNIATTAFVNTAITSIPKITRTGDLTNNGDGNSAQSFIYGVTNIARSGIAFDSGTPSENLDKPYPILADVRSAYPLESTKNKVTSLSSSSTDTQYPSAKCVYDAIDALPEPMVFKGSLGTGGTITALPVDGSATIGDTYKVITAGTYASKTAKIGDTFICLTKTSNANTWEIIPSGDEPSGTVTSVTIKATSPIAIDSSSAITTSGTRTLSHANSGVTAGTYKSVTVNATGHITAGTNPTTLSGYGITDAEASANKVTSLSSSSTDTQYPSAKLLYDKLALKQNNLTAGANIDITNNTISVDGEVLTPLADGSIRIWDLNTGVYSLTDNSISTIYYNGATSTTGILGVCGGLLFVYSLTSSKKAWFFMSDNQTDPYFYLGSMTSSSGSITRLMKKSEIVNNLTTTSEGYMLDARQGKALNDAMEKKSNKVTSISSSSTNTQYPSAKLLYDQLIAAKQLGTAVTATNNNFTIYGKETGLYFITPASGSYLTVYAGDVLDPSKRIEIAYDCTIWITKDSSDPTNYSHFMGIGCAKIEDPDEETDFIYSPIVFYGTASQNDPNNKVILIPLKVQQLNKKVTSWSSTPLHNNYPSEKLVYNSLALKQNQITYSTTDLVEGSATLATGELYVVYE